MSNLRRTTRARLAAVGVAATGAMLLAGCGAANEAPSGGGATTTTTVSGTISGAGASSQQAAMQAWVAGFTGANPGATVNYDPVGSGGGRTQFVAGGVAFAGSDAYLKGDQLTGARTRCGGEVIEIPSYVSPIALIYRIDGVTNLQLSPATIAGVFKRTITTWNAPEIAADNPGVSLPATAITVVNRSDESGTTQNFTEYLKAVAPDIWTFDTSGNWPVAGGEAAQGTSGVVGAVGSGNGTIGYADASQAGSLTVAKVKVGDDFVAPTADAAAKILEASKRVEGQGDKSFAFDLDRTTTQAGTYPIVLVSYLLACPQYPDAAQASLVKAFLGYVISTEGQDAAAKAAGSAPLSSTLQGQIQPVVDGIKAQS